MSIKSSNSQFYQLGGTLEVNAPSYVQRQADENFYQGLKAGEFCYVLNSRQMGKSSLQTRTKQRLEAEGIRCTIVDITEIGTTESTAVEWYAGIVFTLMNGFGLALDFDDWWESLPLLSPVQRFSQFLESVLLRSIPGPIVIFIDEIDSVRSLPFDADDFFAVIRSFYNQRSTEPSYRRLTFALVGSATPVDLIRDMQRTPFNVGRAIELAGFRLDEAAPLAAGLGSATGAMAAILDWTGGQPFLTQKVCELVRRSGGVAGNMSNGEIADWVAGIVRSGITENWEGKDNPVHLRTIQGRVLEVGEAQQGRLLGLYQRVLMEPEGLVGDDSMEQIQLRLSGLVAKRDGRLQVFNRIYREVFDRSWVDGELAKLRPAYYGVAISEWLVAGDESRLLRGEALRDAIAWSEGKQLSDDDSRFLRVSQEAENRAEKEANQILAAAREQAETELTKANRRVKRQASIGGMVLAASLVLAAIAGIGTVKSTDQLKKTEAQRQKIQTINEIEQQGTSALNRSKYEQVQALIDAMRAGQALQSFRKEYGDTGFVASPIYALQSILDVVENRALKPWEKSKSIESKALKGSAPLHQILLVHQDKVNETMFSPDGQHLVTASDDKTARVWDAKTGQQITALHGHRDRVNGAIFSPDGQCIVTISDDKTARVWDAKTGQQITALHGMYAFVKAQFSADGQTIVSASGDTAWVWDAKTGKKIIELQGHKGDVTDTKFSPNAQRIVTASNDKTARVWNAKTGQEIAKLQGHEDNVSAAQFSPDSQRIITASFDKTVRIWDAKTGQEIAKLQGHKIDIRAARFSPDGQRIVTASFDKTARIWDAKTGQEIAKLQGHEIGVSAAQFSPDGQRIVTASFDKTARIWDAKTGQEIAKLQGHESYVTNAQFSPDGQRIITVSFDKIARVWDAQTGQGISKLEDHPEASIRVGAFSLDSKRILTTSADKTLRVWDVKTGQEIAKLQGHKDTISAASFSRDGRHILTTADKIVRLWNAQTGQKITELQGHEEHVSAAQFNPNSQQVITASDDKTARVWDIKTGQEIAKFQGHEDRVSSAQFSPDGQQVITASDDKTARVWDVKTGQEIAKLQGHEDRVSAAQFSPDGQQVITASADKTARVWDIKTGHEIAKLQGHEDRVSAAQFSPDAQRIVTRSTENTVRIWDAKTGHEIIKLQGHESTVSAAQFSPDGQRIVTASADKTARVWDVKTGQEIAKLQGYGEDAYVHAAQFSPDGQSILIASTNRTVWPVESLETLLARGCTWLNNYLIVNPQTLMQLSTCQTPKITQAALSNLIAYSEAQAREGKVSEAINGFTTAKKMNPSLPFDPTQRTNQLAQEGKADVENRAKLRSAISLVEKGEIDKALKVIQKLEQQVPQFTIDAQSWNSLCEAALYKSNPESKGLSACEQAVKLDPNDYRFLYNRGLARTVTGNIPGAIKDFKNLMLENAVTSEKKAEFQSLIRDLEAGKMPFMQEVASMLELADKGEIDNAIITIKQVQKRHPKFTIDAATWNGLCWSGSIYNQAPKVLFACEQAVKLAPSDNMIRDSRGLARALTGNVSGAIEDFQAFAQTTDDLEYKTQRQTWIRDLKAGKNPFTPKVLKSLQN